jgi:hypothetical protein
MPFPMRLSLPVGLILAALPVLLGAQPAPGAPYPGRRARLQMEEGLLGDLFQVRVNRIRQSLGLPEDRSRALAERWRQWDRDLFGSTREMAHLRRKFNDVLLCPAAEEEKNARMKPLLEDFLKVRAQLDQQKHRFEEDIRANLTPSQQARLILLVEEFQQKLREGLRAVREMHHGPQ